MADDTSDPDDVFKQMEAFYTNYTAKILNRTIPFDESKAISFVRGKNQELETQQEDTTQKPSPPSSPAPPPPRLKGDEAKDFYDNLIQSTSSSTHSTIEIRPSNTQAPPSDTMRINKAPYSKPAKNFSRIDMFKFAQEGDLESLSKGFSDTSEHDVNMRDGYGWSLLMCASCAGHASIVDYLLSNGALWKGVVDRCGLDAPKIAEKTGNIELAEYIRTYRTEEEEDTNQDSEIGHCYYCEMCQTDITETPSDHNVSTLHQFNCQHKPNLHSYSLPEGNKGFQMMLRKGWDPERGLGSTGQGHRYPVKTVLKQDRRGIGVTGGKSQKPRVTHFSPGDIRAVRNRHWRLQRERGSEPKTKREREKALRKERSWEINMRHYMNSD